MKITTHNDVGEDLIYVKFSPKNNSLEWLLATASDCNFNYTKISFLIEMKKNGEKNFNYAPSWSENSRFMREFSLVFLGLK